MEDGQGNHKIRVAAFGSLAHARAEMLASALAPALAQQWSADEAPLNVATVTALQPEAGPSRPPPTELPVFDSKAALEQNAVWSRYFLATYGELPDPTSYPLHVTDLDTLYVDRLPPGFFDAMDKRFIPSEDGGSLFLADDADACLGRRQG